MTKLVRPSAIIVKDGRLLLIESCYNGQTFLVFPGGLTEGYEDVAEAMRREVWEETGCDCDVHDIAYVREWINPQKNSNTLDVFFIVTLHKGLLSCAKDPDNDGVVKALRWIDINELDKHDVRPAQVIPNLVKDYHAGHLKPGARSIFLGHAE
jgi:8-oxo-dGTP pyrophosphatase MutT (NUDIX family)